MYNDVINYNNVEDKSKLMGDFEIVRLKPEDFEECNNIWNLRENEKFTKNIYKELTSGDRITFVYKDMKTQNFIGEVSVVFTSQKIYTIQGIRVYLSRLIVKDTWRNNGIGTDLCIYIFEFCERLGYKEITVAVNLDNFVAIKLYYKLGFREILDVNQDEYGTYMVLLKELCF